MQRFCGPWPHHVGGGILANIPGLRLFQHTEMRSGKLGAVGRGGEGWGTPAACTCICMQGTGDRGGGRRPAPWATLAIGEMSQHSACAAQRWAPLETDTGIWAGRGGAGGLRGSIAWRWQ